MKKSFSALVLVAAASGCAFADAGIQESEIVANAIQGVVANSGRSVPYPVLRAGTLADGFHDVIDPLTNRPKISWDRSYAELLIADEYAKCAAELTGIPSRIYSTDGEEYPSFGDSGPALVRVQETITNSACPRVEYRPDGDAVLFPEPVIEYSLRRQDPACNVDPTTGEHRAAIVLPSVDSSSILQNYWGWFRGGDGTSAHAGFDLAPIPDTTTVIDSYRFVYRAAMGVCFARRLNELLDSPEIFTVSTQEHMLILGLVHERAQDSMMKLGHLLKLSRRPSDDMPHTNSVSNPNFGAFLRTWIDSPKAPLERIRSDFLTAVALTSSGATSFASLLQRQAGAGWTSARTPNDFERRWGARSARGRLMRLVFGGSPLADLWGEDVTNMYEYFHPIQGTSDDPIVHVLFSLARKADALYFRPAATGTAVTLDAATWETLYLETELGLRVQMCSEPDRTKCTKDQLRPSLPSLTTPDAFLLKSTYGITLAHAKALSEMLFDAGVRHDFVPGDIGVQATLGAFHLSGVHSVLAPPGRTGETGWFKVDRGTALFAYSLEDRAQWGVSTCSPRVPSWDRLAYCPGFHGPGPEPHGELGALPALSFAREVLFEQTAVTGSSLTDQMLAAMKTIERLTGTTTIVRRPASVDVVLPSSANPSLVNVLGVAATPGLKAAAKDPDYVSPTGTTSREILDDVPNEPSGLRTDNPALSLANVSWDGSTTGTPWPSASTLLLRMTEGATQNYVFLSETREDSTQPHLEPTATVSTKGWFVDLVKRETSVDPTNWSKPAYDGFGLPSNWVPPADASLMGGSPGEESYQYLLRSAKAAAEEATAAVKTAIDKVAEEAADATALSVAETRAQAIGAMEQQSLCGTVTDCELPTTFHDLSIHDLTTPCTRVSATGVKRCEEYLKKFDEKIPFIEIPEPITTAIANKNVGYNASEYSGTELQRVLVRIWNATRVLREARDQAVELAVAAGNEQAAGIEAINVAGAQRDAVDAELEALEGGLDPNTKLGIDQARDALAYTNRAVADQSREAGVMCAEMLQNLCIEQCVPSYAECDGLETTCSDYDSSLFGGSIPFLDDPSIQPWVLDGEQAEERRQQCARLAKGYQDAVIARDTAAETLNRRRELALAELLPDPEPNPATEKMSSLDGAITAVELQAAANLSQGNVQIAAHLGVIAQAVGELKAAAIEWQGLKSRAKSSNARRDLEEMLARQTSDTGASVRRNYRSYDMWRARALLESARRAANAARRSIEARFVVELSELNSEQAFVAAPSTWVDEVYESDLNAPEVVGLSQAPKIDGAVYPNKLVDYVGNLERFVQGYTMTYPVSVSLPDTEVITLGGPERLERDLASASLSVDSIGWRFYCADSRSWKEHPGLGEYPIQNRIASACNGKPPALAKIGFTLDPWGTLNGSWSRPPYVDRYNVRWRRLAVNLVGTGIRDCSKADDSMSCYTNPFVRFDLIHAGMAWQTSHSGEWRALDIPTAHIEGGKALASEEWIEPVSNSWNMPYVANVARGELFGRPAAGNYELVLEVTPDVRLDRIERIQLLIEQDYWVKQTGGQGVYSPNVARQVGSAGAPATTVPAVGGASGTGGSGSGGTTSAGGTTSVGTGYTGECTPYGTDLAIEDFEDGNKIIAPTARRLGAWYGFHAGTCSASPPTTASFVPSPGTNGGGSMGHADGTGCTFTGSPSWSGGGIGFNFLSSYVNGIETVCANYNGSSYTGIAFDAQGSGQVRLEVCTSDHADPDNADCHGAFFSISSTWTRYQARWVNLSQRGWGTAVTFNSSHLRKLQFLSTDANYSFNLDNISFINN